MEGHVAAQHAAVDGQCPRCGTHVSESSRFCRECLLQLAPGEDIGGGQTTLLRNAWERDHPEATQAYEAWRAAPEGPPPGVTDPIAPPGEPQRPLGEWLPLGRRLQWVTIAFAAIVTFDAVSIASNLMEISLLERLRDGEAVSQSELTSNDNRVMILSMLQGLLYITCAVVFIMWFHRAYKNLDALRSGRRRHGTGWAIGGWFVPILSIWRPKEIANDLWVSGSEPKEDPPNFLLFWWICFLISSIAGNWTLRSFGDDTPQGMIDANQVFAFTNAVDILTAILAIVVAKRITARLEARRQAEVNQPAQAAALPA